jgi:hypothetical protein
MSSGRDIGLRFDRGWRSLGRRVHRPSYYRLWQSTHDAVAGLATSQTVVFTGVRHGGSPRWYRGETTVKIMARATMINIRVRTE